MKIFPMVFIVLIFITVGHCQSIQTLPEHVTNFEVKVLLAYGNEREKDQILNTYQSVLDEEGVSYKAINVNELFLRSPSQTAIQNPAVIFSDGIVTYMPDDAGKWIESYVKAEGNVAIIYDAGTKNEQNRYRINSNYLDGVLGLDMMAYSRMGKKAYSLGNIIFKQKNAADFFEIPPGKIDENGTLCGYQYGPLSYPVSQVKIIDTIGIKVFATDQYGTPLITLKQIGKGNILYVNTPLGYLKGRSDDLLLRSVLKTFLFRIAYIPHLVSSPNAKGTVVINWHIDSSVELNALPWAFQNNYFRKDLVQSFHITAGPDLDVVGDKLGFDATGKGRSLVEKIMSYGKIGSHGGWRHNWFAKNIQEGLFGKDEMKHYIKMNNDTLESIVGYKMTEYSSPVGVFPPKTSVEIMEELGIKAFYYLGDAGSAPNRTFFDGHMLSGDVIAFPVMTFGRNVSFYEMTKSQWSEEKVEETYKDLVDYIVKNRTIRLVYGHPHDIYDYGYKTAEKHFLDYISNSQKDGKLQTRTMTDIAEFLLKVVKTEKKFLLEKDTLHIEIKNGNGLKDLVVAVPKKMSGRKFKAEGFKEDAYYYYIPLEEDASQTVMDFTFEDVSNPSSKKKDKK